MLSDQLVQQLDGVFAPTSRGELSGPVLRRAHAGGDEIDRLRGESQNHAAATSGIPDFHEHGIPTGLQGYGNLVLYWPGSSAVRIGLKQKLIVDEQPQRVVVSHLAGDFLFTCRPPARQCVVAADTEPEMV